ncbi:MAG: transketolase [Oligoflexia bacterium]|nr:transketolase [Oligoflexia bacterium]
MKTKNKDDLLKISLELRRDIIRMAICAGGCHIGGAFSAVEILTAIYFGGVLDYDPLNPLLENRDRFILSKGHASVLLYAVLSKAGFFPREELFTFCQLTSRLGGHPKKNDLPGVEASTGSLGHGLSFAAGIALSAQMDRRPYHVYVLLGDGECQEGSVWEAGLFIAQKNLLQLTVIIDHNKLQAMDRLDNIIEMGEFAEKWRAFGFEVYEVDGHDIMALIKTFTAPASKKPRLILAHTTKGKGISFMENMPLWHYRNPNLDEIKIIEKELSFSLATLL